MLVSNGTSSPTYNNTLTLTSTLSNTTTVVGNALQVTGGVGIGASLYVDGPAYFTNNVVFSGTSTYVYSTNTVYTDNLINIHVPAGSTGTDHTWVVDDGKDIGFIYHYYKGQDKDAFLGLSNTTGYLEWYDNGTELSSVYNGTNYGTFKTGGIILTNTTTSTSTTTGALIVTGGVGIGGNLYVGGNTTLRIVNATSGTFSGTLEVIGTTTLGVVNATSGTFSGTLGVTGTTTLDGITNITNTTSATSTSTGALVITGGVGIGGALWIKETSYIDSGQILTTSTIGQFGVTRIIGGTDTAVSTSTGVVTIWNTSNLQSVTNRGSLTTNAISVTNIAASTSTVTGALTVVGGVGIGGALYASFVYDNNNRVVTSVIASGTTYIGISNLVSTGTATSFTVSNLGVQTLTAGTDTSVSSNTGTITIWNTSTLQSVTDRGATTTNAISVTNTAASTSTVTGALQVVGGVGIGGNLYVGRQIVTEVGTNSAPSIILDPAYLQTGFVAGQASASPNTIDTVVASAVVTRTNSSGFSIFNEGSSSNAALKIGANGYGGLFASGTSFLGISWANTRPAAFYAAGTSSTSTTTGALVVTGGVGIGNNLHVGGTGVFTGDVVANSGNITTFNTGTFNLINSGATNINFAGSGTAVTISSSTGYTNIRNLTTLTNDTSATSTNTGALQVVGGVGIGGKLYVGDTINGNLAGGSTGAIVYQSSTNTTAFLNIGNTDYILQSNGSAPVWISLSGVSAGLATTATNLKYGTAGQVPYQTAPGVTDFYGPGTAGQLLVSSGTNAPVYTNTSSIYVGRADVANTATTATNLTAGTAGQIPYQTAPGVTSFYGPGTAGNVLVSNGTSAPSYNNTLTLVGTTTSISTTTGALQVLGGVGVGGSVYVGNRVGFVGTTQASVVYQVYNAATNSLDTVFG